jgi:hypothetical protein
LAMRRVRQRGFAQLYLLPPPLQKVDLFIATGQRRQAPVAERLEPTFGTAGANYLPSRNRFRQALQCDASEFAIVEKAENEMAGASGNQYRVRLRYGLEVDCETRGLPDRCEPAIGLDGGYAAQYDEP